MAVNAATVNGNPRVIFSTYLETAPTNAQTVITKTVFTGLLRALFFGRENSVNATSNGGAIANLKPDQIAKNPTTATQIVLTAVSITSLFACRFTD